jgi:hypothetical protein
VREMDYRPFHGKLRRITHNSAASSMITLTYVIFIFLPGTTMSDNNVYR